MKKQLKVKDFGYIRTETRITADYYRHLDMVTEINWGIATAYFKVYQKRECVYEDKSLGNALEAYNDISE